MASIFITMPLLVKMPVILRTRVSKRYLLTLVIHRSAERINNGSHSFLSLIELLQLSCAGYVNLLSISALLSNP